MFAQKVFLYMQISQLQKRYMHGELQALATEIWGKICPPSDPILPTTCKDVRETSS